MGQRSLFEEGFIDILDLEHPLCKLTQLFDWETIDKKLGALFGDTKKRRPPIATRVMVALHYLKFTFDLSDEEVVSRFSENNYWQYFAGYSRFCPELPCDSTTMVKWRKKMKKKGFDFMLEETIEIAKRTNLIGRRDCEKVIVDTTVQEKNITFPTDAKLLHKARENLVDAANNRGIQLRQSYVRVGKKSLFQQSRFARAKQIKKARRETRRLKTFLGRVKRDIERKCVDPDTSLQQLLAQANRLLEQKKHDKNKLYSLHEPHVECIAKGKAHKKYEFGCKVSVVTTSKSNWILSSKAIHGNPYDGHTLKQSLENAEKMSGRSIKTAYVDQGYRGSARSVPQTVEIAGSRKKRSRSARLWLRRRSAIEPVIGHLKSDHRMGKNYLKGADGDHTNAVLSGCGFNFRKLLAAFLFLQLFAEISFHRVA